MTSISEQFCHKYALDIHNNKIPACRKVKSIAKRHLDDLETDSDFYFNSVRADHCLNWMSNILTVHGKPHCHIQWQYFVIGCIMGWARKSDNGRRFQTSVCITGKGSAKTKSAAALGLYLLCADRYRVEVAPPNMIVLANTADQSTEYLRMMAEYIDESAALDKRLLIYGGDANPTQIRLKKEIGKGQIKRWASDNSRGQFKGKSGGNLNVIFSEELGEIHGESNELSWAWDQRKNAIEPLLWLSANPSTDTNLSELGKYYNRAARMLDGEKDDTLFAYIAELDEDSPRTVAELIKEENKKYWYYPNPGLIDNFPREDYLREQLATAKGIPSKEGQCLRVNFGLFTATELSSVLISPELFNSLETRQLSPIDERVNWETSIGIDLSRVTQATSHNDLSAIAQTWRNPDTFELEMEVTSFISANNIEKRQEFDGIPWVDWANAGYVTAVPGNWLQWDMIAEEIKQRTLRQQNIKGLSFDAYYFSYLRDALNELGIFDDILPEYLHRQTSQPGRSDGQQENRNILYMPRSIMHFLQAAKNQNLKIKKNPVTRMAFLGIKSKSDFAGNLTVDKTRPSVKIDAAVAAIQSIGLLQEYKADSFAGYWEAMARNSDK